MKATQFQYSPKIIQKITQLETICGQDVGRGIHQLVQASKGGLLAAASSIAEHNKPHVAIITGFFLPHASPAAAETDGPVGCAQLATGLTLAGIPVRIVTDSLCFPTVQTAIVAAGISSQIVFDIIPTQSGGYHQVTSLLNRWETMKLPVSHVIAIERPGPGEDGIIRNMRGYDITAYTAPLHLLFKSKNIISIGIGDGGNEMGMGKIPKDIITKSILNGDKIACTTTCNHLIVCGVSNWGATGLLTALSLLRPDWKKAIFEILNPATEYHILESIVHQGFAVDGVSGKQSLSVDNLPYSFHAEFLQKAVEVVRS